MHQIGCGHELVAFEGKASWLYDMHFMLVFGWPSSIFLYRQHHPTYKATPRLFLLWPRSMKTPSEKSEKSDRPKAPPSKKGNETPKAAPKKKPAKGSKPSKKSPKSKKKAEPKVKPENKGES